LVEYTHVSWQAVTLETDVNVFTHTHTPIPSCPHSPPSRPLPCRSITLRRPRYPPSPHPHPHPSVPNPQPMSVRQQRQPWVAMPQRSTGTVRVTPSAPAASEPWVGPLRVLPGLHGPAALQQMVGVEGDGLGFAVEGGGGSREGSRVEACVCVRVRVRV
jgi:hypothetical protein